jgi:hypothetical protein
MIRIMLFSYNRLLQRNERESGQGDIWIELYQLHLLLDVYYLRQILARRL